MGEFGGNIDVGTLDGSHHEVSGAVAAGRYGQWRAAGGGGGEGFSVLTLQRIGGVEGHHRDLRNGAGLAVVIVDDNVAVSLRSHAGEAAGRYAVLSKTKQAIGGAGELCHTAGAAVS